MAQSNEVGDMSNWLAFLCFSVSVLLLGFAVKAWRDAWADAEL